MLSLNHLDRRIAKLEKLTLGTEDEREAELEALMNGKGLAPLWAWKFSPDEEEEGERRIRALEAGDACGNPCEGLASLLCPKCKA